MELLKLCGLSLKEVSALTGLSIGALKLATHRAMRSLRRVLLPGTDEVKTDDLIDRLGRDASVVKPLPAPGIRTAVWLAWAAVYLVVVTVVMLAQTSTGWCAVAPR